MRALKPKEIGLMFWAGQSAEESLQYVRQFGLQAGQLGFGGEMDLDGAAGRWSEALAGNPDFCIPTAVCSYVGEDYADIAAVESSVGLTPLPTRAERVRRTKQVAAIATELGIPGVACHIGMIPSDRNSDEYRLLCDVARDLCDDMGARGQHFALETGQEPAAALLEFLADVNRGNLKINFDPANMILYGTGEPVEALRLLREHVVSVHCKDGDWPSEPEALGLERRLGAGRVDFEQFLRVLSETSYSGILSIEREEPDPAVRRADIAHAVEFLQAFL